jgi:CheY-like chemotaxis protein
VSPRVIDLNKTVEGMLKMIRRLIGEDIDLLWKPAKNLWPVKIDLSQMDQILVNLCINARDAISGVGKLTIETRNIVFDESYCAFHLECSCGPFAMLSVSDSGQGIEKENISHIFDPFFTTKQTGMGTGLGLSTVYGIVKQNGGFINVYSEPGKGTTFKIYLPGVEDQSSVPIEKITTRSTKGQGEMVLVVEDQDDILEMSKDMLEELGYTTLTAQTPGEALRLAKTHGHNIQLLLTDVVMPEMNGRDLADKLTTLNPELKPLFMSGYTANVIAHHGVLDEGTHFIQKPFSMEELAVKIGEVLEHKPVE